MTAPLGDQPRHLVKEVKGISGYQTSVWELEVPIGASGATGTLAGPYPNGIAIAKNGTGIYDITGMPICPAGKGRLYFSFFSPLLTVTHYTLTARDFTLGTATVKMLKNDLAAEPASGDVIWIMFRGEEGPI